MRKKKKRLIAVFSLKYSGTHFALAALMLHRDVSLAINRGAPFGKTTWGALQKRFIDGEISFAEFEKHALDYELDLGIERAYRQELLNWNLLPKSGCEKYVLMQMHFDSNRGFDWTKYLKTVVPIREPLSVAISAMWRGWLDADMLLSAFDYVSRLEGVFFLPVDLKPHRFERALKMYDFFGLTPTEECLYFLRKWPKMGSINDDWWRVEKYLGKEFAREIRASLEQYNRRKIHPLLEYSVRILKGLKLQPFFEALGYENLLWYD